MTTYVMDTYNFEKYQNLSVDELERLMYISDARVEELSVVREIQDELHFANVESRHLKGEWN